MEESHKKLCAHLIICTSCSYKLPDGSDSSPDEAYNLRKRLKSRAKEKFGSDLVRVTSSNCLGECARGIASVMYPGQTWQVELTPADEDKLFETIEKIVNKTQV